MKKNHPMNNALKKIALTGILLFAYPLLYAATANDSNSPQTDSKVQAPTAATSVIAIGRPAEGADRAAFGPHMEKEVRSTLMRYLDGRISALYSLKSEPGVLFVLNAGDVDSAREILADLPLVKAELLEFEFIPIGPLEPFRRLL